MPVLDESIAYQTTSNELNVRIQLRDTILLALVGGAAAFIGVLLPLDPGRRHAGIVIPFVVFIATIMIFHHDWIILLNAKFLRELEARGEPTHRFWHSHPAYPQALLARLLFNMAHVLAVVLISVASLMLAGEQGPTAHERGWRVWYVLAIAVSVASCMLAFLVGVLRLHYGTIRRRTGSPAPGTPGWRPRACRRRTLRS